MTSYGQDASINSAPIKCKCEQICVQVKNGKTKQCPNAEMQELCTPENCAITADGGDCSNGYPEWKRVKKMSHPTMGFQLISLTQIPKNEPILPYAGEYLYEAEKDKLLKKIKGTEAANYMMSVQDASGGDTGDVIDAYHFGSLAKWANHSCNANCVARTHFYKGQSIVIIYSLTDIAIGDAITINYRTDLKKMGISKCLCNGRDCADRDVSTAPLNADSNLQAIKMMTLAKDDIIYNDTGDEPFLEIHHPMSYYRYAKYLIGTQKFWPMIRTSGDSYMPIPNATPYALEAYHLRYTQCIQPRYTITECEIPSTTNKAILHLQDLITSHKGPPAMGQQVSEFMDAIMDKAETDLNMEAMDMLVERAHHMVYRHFSFFHLEGKSSEALSPERNKGGSVIENERLRRLNGHGIPSAEKWQLPGQDPDVTTWRLFGTEALKEGQESDWHKELLESLETVLALQLHQRYSVGLRGFCFLSADGATNTQLGGMIDSLTTSIRENRAIMKCISEFPGAASFRLPETFYKMNDGLFAARKELVERIASLERLED
jgi:hypothetical protein